MPPHFLSHKFSRLALPWAMLLGVGATIALPASWFRTLMLLCEGGVGLLALMNGAIPKGWKLKRLSSPARTFLVMNAAALAAVVVFFVPATRIWSPTVVQARKAGS